jgi:DNA polymerase III delta prime subunit
MKEEIPESFWEALVEVKDKDIEKARELFQTAMELAKKYKDERDEYKIGHDRYEKLRRLSPMQFHELYEKNIKTGEHFDKLVDKLI